MIAYAGGGALDTVVPGETGEFFAEPTVESLGGVLAAFDPATYDPEACRRNAERFGEARFIDELSSFIDKNA